MMLGIQATRLIASRQGRFSYTDGTPRLMTQEEKLAIFDDPMADRFCAIVKLIDEHKMEAVGYGVYLKSDKPKGMEKVNTPQNMAFIRAERQALDRLRPGEMPQDVGVVDAEYEVLDTDTGEITESPAEFVEVSPDTDKIPEPEPTEQSDTDSTNPFAVVDDLKVALTDYGKTKYITAVSKDALQMSMQDLGIFIKAKGWQVKTLNDLNPEQLGIIHQALNDGKI